jgi:hypothetical protein
MLHQEKLCNKNVRINQEYWELQMWVLQGQLRTK